MFSIKTILPLVYTLSCSHVVFAVSTILFENVSTYFYYFAVGLRDTISTRRISTKCRSTGKK